ncbi:ATPase family protein associated with various cellular activities (AAA) [Humibacillus xanthopallidus]|uniref:ATPase family protein associated with various cellular activities (AAA) n=1 Tax=Humibacillus xanthopallidus TaxID=412689 RepID=A0A543PL36_9MICO|nr:ATP-binding protein [Humibacillus xanthopallidus]TQN44780.1 ATPase family protein associated with various cellular activities (AAA) [Humibacillus xanthopallidus]
MSTPGPDGSAGAAGAEGSDAPTSPDGPTAPGSETAPSAEAQRDLVVAELDIVRALVTGADADAARARLAALRETVLGASALDEIETGFGLSAFERQTLLLACGPDLVGDVARELLEHTGQARLCFGTALSTLPDAHWDALTHQAPLRHWGLVRLADPDALLSSPLVPDERIVHHLVGIAALDERLSALSQPVEAPEWLPPTLGAVAGEVVSRWAASGPVVLHGPQPATTRAVAAAACAAVGLTPRLLGAADLAATTSDLVVLLRHLVRETVLARVAWLVDLDDLHDARVSVTGLGRALTTCDAPVVLLASTGPGGASIDGMGLPVLEVPRLGVGDRRRALVSALDRVGATVPEQEVAAAAGAFDLSVADVEIVAAETAQGRRLWSACRRRPRADVGNLARVRIPRAGWDDLVLPEPQLEQLRALVAAVRHRSTVLEDWGFAARTSRGLGTAALFAGASGTGKTFAAEVIAHELELDLVHVDLSQVVDKYLGETEKRLSRLFDAAENGGMVLLFDEADALFGKRSEVKDSHDRYANVEVGYLLQRLESFAGLAVLTTNARSALDQAFTRRLSAIVTFPYPDRAARLRMWSQALPVALPHADLDLPRLSEADLSGGGIASAALQAAYLAADDGGELTMEQLTRAVRWELAKTGRAAVSAPRATTRSGRSA